MNVPAYKCLMTAPPAASAHWTPRLDRGGKPVYLAVADAIADDVRNGRLSPGARLPAQRDLARALGIDLTTVTRAYNEARRRGLVSATVGRGSFVASAPAVQPYGAPSGAPVDLTMNLPPPFEDRALVRRMWRGFSELEARHGLTLLLRYQDPGGSAEDRAAGALWLSDRIPGLSPDRTLVSAGAQPALMAVIGALANRGDTICCEPLVYPGLRAAAAQLGVELAPLEVDEQGIVPDALLRACRETGPKALCCTPTLQNPTTATMSLSRRQDIVAVARRFRLPIIEDDAYGKLPLDPLPPLAALASELTWHIAGLAKLASPALRIAYVATPDAKAVGPVAAGLRAATGMASPITAALASLWIDNGTMAEVLSAVRGETRARRLMAAEILGPRFVSSAEAFHLWLTLPPRWTRAAFQAALQARDVSVAPSDAFVVTGEPPEAVRISLGAPPSRAELAGALACIRDVLNEGQSAIMTV
jgi:DNA-binding transcriptional MocR family regulator